MGSERGEQPLSRCGERGVQRERGGSRNTPLTLWPSGATPAAMRLAKGIRPAPRDHPLCGKRRFRMPSALLWAYLAEIKFLYWQFRLIASVPPRGKADPLCLPFFCNFLRDFRLIFRWKAVVDSVQFRVILNITTKRFDVASWHAEMLRFGRRPTAADAACRNDPSREKATLENPQIFQSCKSKNFISAAIARAKRRQFQIVHPTNERSLTTLESTTP